MFLSASVLADTVRFQKQTWAFKDMNGTSNKSFEAIMRSEPKEKGAKIETLTHLYDVDRKIKDKISALNYQVNGKWFRKSTNSDGETQNTMSLTLAGKNLRENHSGTTVRENGATVNLTYTSTKTGSIAEYVYLDTKKLRQGGIRVVGTNIEEKEYKAILKTLRK